MPVPFITEKKDSFTQLMSEPLKFLYALTHLNRAPTRFGKAPHKLVLLLALLELMESGYASENRFYPDAEITSVQSNGRHVLLNIFYTYAFECRE
jgi:hypothetical protein